MGTNIDWLSIVNGDLPKVPPSFREIIDRADEVFRRKDDVAAIPADLREATLDMAFDLYRSMRLALLAQSAVLQRAVIFALLENHPIEECALLFRRLSALGFSSPVEKAQLVVILLQYLRNRVASSELKSLVDSMSEELRVCLGGCEENIEVLKTFLAEPDSDPDTPHGE